jgi:hypothetical protein
MRSLCCLCVCVSRLKLLNIWNSLRVCVLAYILSFINYIIFSSYLLRLLFQDQTVSLPVFLYALKLYASFRMRAQWMNDNTTIDGAVMNEASVDLITLSCVGEEYALHSRGTPRCHLFYLPLFPCSHLSAYVSQCRRLDGTHCAGLPLSRDSGSAWDIHLTPRWSPSCWRNVILPKDSRRGC